MCTCGCGCGCCCHYHCHCGCGRHHHGGYDSGDRGGDWGHESHEEGDCGCDESPRLRWGHSRHEHRHGEEHGSHASFHRRYMTKEEQIAMLQPYLRDLQAEVKAVEERLAALKASA